MKLALAAITALLPILASAAATTVSVPLIKQKESAARGTKDCLYESDYRLGDSESIRPFQVYAEDEDDILRLVMSPLRADKTQNKNGFFVRLSGYQEVQSGATCPSHVDLIVLQ